MDIRNTSGIAPNCVKCTEGTSLSALLNVRFVAPGARIGICAQLPVKLCEVEVSYVFCAQLRKPLTCAWSTPHQQSVHARS